MLRLIPGVPRTIGQTKGLTRAVITASPTLTPGDYHCCSVLFHRVSVLLSWWALDIRCRQVYVYACTHVHPLTASQRTPLHLVMP